MRFLIALLAVAGIVVSSLALRIHKQDPSIAPPCAVSEHWDCGSVNHSRYAVFPASTFDEAPGTNSTSPSLCSASSATRSSRCSRSPACYKLVLPAALVGFGFAAYLTYLEKFVMQKWCIYCVWSFAIITTTLLVTVITLIRSSPSPTLP